MEITCNRCHQAVPAGSSYCPNCGLPQLVYSSEESGGVLPVEQVPESARDASAVEWKPALRAAILLAIPAGLLSCGLSPVGLLGFFWMAVAASWAVSLYIRRQRPAWITMGAGARIGLATGLIAGWLAFASTGVALFAMRYWMHQGNSFDQTWSDMVKQTISRQVETGDPQSLEMFKSLMLSPHGRAGVLLCGMLLLEIGYLIFAAVGGAFGARMMARSRRPEL